MQEECYFLYCVIDETGKGWGADLPFRAVLNDFYIKALMASKRLGLVRK